MLRTGARECIWAVADIHDGCADGAAKKGRHLRHGLLPRQVVGTVNLDSPRPVSAARPLRVAALVKQIPEVESMTLGPDGRLNRSGVSLHMNDYCRRAVAQGRILAQESGGSLTVITLGPASAENVLREAIAFGADRGVLVTDPAFAGSDSLATARALAAALDRLDPFDLVLTGRNAIDAETGQVPPQLATLLDLPFVAGTRQLRLAAETLHLRLEHDDEWVDAQVDLPALISCAERLCDPCKVKDASLWAGVDRRRIRRITAGDLGSGPWGQQGSPTSVGVVHEVASPRAARVIGSSTVAEHAAAIMAVLADRAALGGEPDQVGGRALPATGTDGGPEIVVAVEPAREGITAELLGAAAGLASDVGGHVVAFGPSIGDSRQLSGWGADHAVQVRGAEIDEDVAFALAQRCQRRQPWAVLGPSTTWGREVLARAAAALGAGLIGDAIDLRVRRGRLVASKPAFGGLLVAEIHCSSPVQMVTVRGGVFRRPAARPAAAIAVTTTQVKPRGRVRVYTRTRVDDIGQLATAERVIGVGAGVDPQDYGLLRSMASQMGATLAATRKVTDAGSLPRARQVGITGHSIAPRLFISIGSSGKFNHTVGLRNAGTIVAINTDPAAPIFRVVDVGVVADWRDVLPVLAAAIGAARRDVAESRGHRR